MLSRNPELHYIFAQMEMAEERGLGIKSLKNRAMQLGLPLPRYTFEDPYLVLTLYRNPTSAVRDLHPDIRNQLSADDMRAWEFLSSKDAATSPDLMKKLGYDERKSQRILKKLMNLGLLRRVGKGRSTRYEAKRS